MFVDRSDVHTPNVSDVPLHPAAAARIEDCLAHAGHAGQKTSALFRALRNPAADGRFSDTGVYSNVVLHYGRPLKLTDLPLFGPHVMRATAATNALEHGADIAKVRSGSATRTSRRPGSTTGAIPGRRTRRRSRWRTRRRVTLFGDAAGRLSFAVSAASHPRSRGASAPDPPGSNGARCGSHPIQSPDPHGFIVRTSSGRYHVSAVRWSKP